MGSNIYTKSHWFESNFACSLGIPQETNSAVLITTPKVPKDVRLGSQILKLSGSSSALVCFTHQTAFVRPNDVVKSSNSIKSNLVSLSKLRTKKTSADIVTKTAYIDQIKSQDRLDVQTYKSSQKKIDESFLLVPKNIQKNSLLETNFLPKKEKKQKDKKSQLAIKDKIYIASPYLQSNFGGSAILHKMPSDNLVDYSYKKFNMALEGVKIPLKRSDYPVKEVNMNGFHRAQSLQLPTIV